MSHPVFHRRKRPIDLQTLAKLHDENCYCVDKSGMAIDLIGVEFSRAARNVVGFEVETLAA